MDRAIDQTRPHPLSCDAVGAVHANIDWTARCSKRLVALDPRLSVGQALDLARELCVDGELRVLAPEQVAEDLYRIDLQIED